MTNLDKNYFLNSKEVLLAVGLAFFLTNCIEFLFILLFSFLAKKSIDMNSLFYFIQSITIIASLWLSFRIFRSVPIYVIALSVSVVSTLFISTLTLAFSSISVIEFIITHLVSSFVLIFIWMHLSQNLENKPKALKIGYFTFYIAIECLSLISSSIAGENHILFLLIAIIGYKISSVVFELMIKISFKLFHVDTTIDHSTLQN